MCRRDRISLTIVSKDERLLKNAVRFKELSPGTVNGGHNWPNNTVKKIIVQLITVQREQAQTKIPKESSTREGQVWSNYKR